MHENFEVKTLWLQLQWQKRTYSSERSLNDGKYVFENEMISFCPRK